MKSMPLFFFRLMLLLLPFKLTRLSLPSAIKNACSCFFPCDKIRLPAGNSYKQTNKHIYRLLLLKLCTIKMCPLMVMNMMVLLYYCHELLGKGKQLFSASVKNVCSLYK